MLVLGTKKEPQRITLRAAVGTPGKKGFEPEAWVLLAPITPPMRRRAQRAARRKLGDVTEFSEVDVDRLIDAGEIGSRELVRLGLIEWGGFGDADGHEIALTPDRDTRFATANQPDRPTGTIDLLFEESELVERIDELYVRPDALRRAEKNASSASPSGTGAAATQAGTTAGSRAARKAKKTAAKPANTASTRRKPKPAKASGAR